MVRVKLKTVTEGKPQSEKLITYIKDLKRYLDDSNITLLDYNNDHEELTTDLFRNLDYFIIPRGQTFFTKRLANDTKHLLK